MLRALAVLAALAAAVPSAFATISMTHISMTGDPTQMAVDFVSSTSSVSTIYLGKDGTSFPIKVSVDSYYYDEVGYLHTGVFTGLTANTQYYYKIEDDSGSNVYSFVNQPTARPPVYAILADFGYENGQSLPKLLLDAAAGTFDYVILAGDQAYDLDYDSSTVGNNYMKGIEPVASQFPWMACPGNHENAANFSQFRSRFYGLEKYVGANSGSHTSIYYSWTQGIVHFLSISTEVYNYSPDPVEQANQIRFMEKDLAAANANRANVPWIVMYGHKGWYMDTTNWTDFGTVSSKYGVDLFFCGHVHNYERFVPYDAPSGQADFASVSADKGTYTNPKYLTTIVTGAAGNREDEVPCNATLASVTAACTPNYGYGFLQVFNATHAHWHWETAAPAASASLRGSSVAADFSDDLWVIQNNHGMRL